MKPDCAALLPGRRERTGFPRLADTVQTVRPNSTFTGSPRFQKKRPMHRGLQDDVLQLVENIPMLFREKEQVQRALGWLQTGAAGLGIPDGRSHQLQ